MAPGLISMHLDSTGWQSILESGRHDLQNEDFRSAIFSFNSFLSKVAGDPSLKFALVEAHIGKGIALMGLKDYHEAIESFSVAFSLTFDANYSRRVEILWRRGQAYQRAGHVTRAIADYTCALSENPKFFDAFLSRGILLFSLSQYTQAYSDFSFAIQMDPKNCEPYIWRAECLLLRKASPSYSELSSIVQDCTTALSIAPINSRVMIIKARAHLGLHQYSHAKQAYASAVSLNPSFADEELSRAVNRGLKRNSESELRHHDKRLCSNVLKYNV